MSLGPTQGMQAWNAALVTMEETRLRSRGCNLDVWPPHVLKGQVMFTCALPLLLSPGGPLG